MTARLNGDTSCGADGDWLRGKPGLKVAMLLARSLMCAESKRGSESPARHGQKLISARLPGHLDYAAAWQPSGL